MYVNSTQPCWLRCFDNRKETTIVSTLEEDGLLDVNVDELHEALEALKELKELAQEGPSRDRCRRHQLVEKLTKLVTNPCLPFEHAAILEGIVGTARSAPTFSYTLWALLSRPDAPFSVVLRHIRSRTTPMGDIGVWVGVALNKSMPMELRVEAMFILLNSDYCQFPSNFYYMSAFEEVLDQNPALREAFESDERAAEYMASKTS